MPYSSLADAPNRQDGPKTTYWSIPKGLEFAKTARVTRSSHALYKEETSVWKADADWTDNGKLSTSRAQRPDSSALWGAALRFAAALLRGGLIGAVGFGKGMRTPRW